MSPRTSITGRDCPSVGWSVTQTFDDQHGAPIGLLGFVPEFLPPDFYQNQLSYNAQPKGSGETLTVCKAVSQVALLC